MPAAPTVVVARRVKFVVGLLAMIATLGSAPPASATTDDGWYAAGLVNETRAWTGTHALSVDGYLSEVAQAWADRMAARGRLAHNPGLAWAMDGWWAWGENVGYGDSVAGVHGLFLDSWHHYGNIVDGAYSSIGVGVAHDEWGWVYVVHVFGG
ncbi:MAG: CAP domain-containing protein [Acidimicrobiia bacterium]